MEARVALGAPVTWNHRVLRHKNQVTGEPYVAVHEVYYGEDGQPDSWTVDPISLVNDDLADMREELEMIRWALDKPLLEVAGERLVEVAP